MGRRYIKGKYVWLLVLGIIFIFPSLAFAAGDLQVIPSQINIGLNFRGARLTLTGDKPQGAAVYVKVTSPADAVFNLSRKGKVGPFWMNVENATVTHVPKLYQVLSSRPIHMLSPDLQHELGIDKEFSSIYKNAVVKVHAQEKQSGNREEKVGSEYIRAMINICSGYGLYKVKENAVKDEGARFTARIDLPSSIPQENCQVTVYFIKNGDLVSSKTANFNVTSVGLTRLLAEKEIYNGPEFGLFAVVVALLAGVLVAVLFGALERMTGGKKGMLSETSH
ncbi:TIGR02186 family protein [Desulfurispora thermophila]|uniref:TIGR02186 family protein n=1 Tax=Desulfurispora thermophila TaxID=265470 RepID=UPI00036F801C|nr:TIGR02186 family protein [Desulfurispora thermophila]